MLVMTCLFVTVTGVNFWITDYLIKVIGVERSKAFELYLTASVVGPLIGVLGAAFIFDRIGGYTSEFAHPLCLTVALFGMVSALSSVLVHDSAVTCAMFITLQFVCGAFVKPVITGIMLNQVPPKLRTMANSVANLSYNLLGFLPAPIMYGFFYELSDDPHNHYGLLSVQGFTMFAVAGLTLIYIRNRYIESKYSLEDIELVDVSGESGCSQSSGRIERNRGEQDQPEF